MRIGQIRFVFMPRKQLTKPDCLKQRCIDGLRKSADAHAELHPLEEQLRPPAVLAELCDGQRGQAGVAGQKRQGLVALSVNILDAPQLRTAAGGNPGRRDP